MRGKDKEILKKASRQREKLRNGACAYIYNNVYAFNAMPFNIADVAHRQALPKCHFIEVKNKMLAVVSQVAQTLVTVRKQVLVVPSNNILAFGNQQGFVTV